MAYKRYIKRGGKVYGPYIYKSRKENGKVISEYVGRGKLNSMPQITVLFEGNPLPDEIYEFKDLKKYNFIKNEFGVNWLTRGKWDKLNEKYGLK